jgi:hypothetical protein
MKRVDRDSLALRREALAARATLQRLQLRAALEDLRDEATSPRVLGAVALRLAGRLVFGRTGASLVAAGGRPWMLSAGLLAIRALRAHPSARWVAGAGLAAATIWWIARSAQAPDQEPDETG